MFILFLVLLFINVELYGINDLEIQKYSISKNEKIKNKQKGFALKINIYKNFNYTFGFEPSYLYENKENFNLKNYEIKDNYYISVGWKF